MPNRTLALVVAVVALGVGVASADQTPLAVSPGDPEELALVEVRCPTFSWAAVDGAVSYEVVVYPVDPQGANTEPVLVETLPGGVTAWTPSLERCLERGGSYAWSVRANLLKEPTDWSAATFFRVASGPPGSETRQLLEAVQYLLAADAAGAGLIESAEQPAGGPEASVGPRAAPGYDTKLLVEEGHLAVRRDGLGFIQLDTRNNSAPGPSYCDHITDTGRMVLRVGFTRRLYICTTDGVTPAWRYVSLP